MCTRIVEGLHEFPNALGAFQEFALERRASFKNPDQVLEAFLPRVGSLACTNSVRDMARKGNSLLPGLVSDGEHSLARDQRLQLDKVRAAPLKIVYRLAAVLGGANCNGAWKTRLRPVEHRSRANHPLTEQLSLA